jgi:hypothetical protein
MIYNFYRVVCALMFIICINMPSYAKKLPGIKTFLSHFKVAPYIGYYNAQQEVVFNNVNLYEKDDVFYLKEDNNSIYIIQWPYDNPIKVSKDYINDESGVLQDLKTYSFACKMHSIPIGVLVYCDFANKFRFGLCGQAFINSIKNIVISELGLESEKKPYPKDYVPRHSTHTSTAVSLLLGYKFLSLKRVSLLIEQSYAINFSHPYDGFLRKNLGASLVSDMGICCEVNLMKNFTAVGRIGYKDFYSSIPGYLPSNIDYNFSMQGIYFTVGASFSLSGTTYPKCSVLGCNANSNHSHGGIYYSPK